MIDAKAIIDPSARIAADVAISPFAIIGPGVEIGAGTTIGSHTVIHRNTKIGRNNRINAFVSLGGDPQHLQYNGEPTYLEIGDENIIQEFCTVSRGTPQSESGGITRIGNKNFLMAYVHVAHDCHVGNNIIFANSAGLAGHVTVGDYAGFSAFTGVHQFVNIGAYSFLGRSTKVVQDIPPYVIVTGNPGTPHSLNLVGLKRAGFDEATIRTLRQAFVLVYRKGLLLSEALEQLIPKVEKSPELKLFVESFQRSTRGVAR